MEHSAGHSAEHGFTLLPSLNLPGLSPEQALMVEYTWLSMAVIIIMVIAVIISLKKIPYGFQNLIELLTSFIENSLIDIIGSKGLSYFPLVVTAFTFILVANYIGLVPGCMSPTASINTTAGWAIVVFVFYQYLGITKQGLHYFKHFLGPVPIMAPLMIITETISEFARPVSLSVRLFANIFGGEMIIKILFGMCAVGVPIIWMFWDSLITIPLQAFIFSLLTMIYISGAVAANEDH